jgi:hypothetical protein
LNYSLFTPPMDDLVLSFFGGLFFACGAKNNPPAMRNSLRRALTHTAHVFPGRDAQARANA